MAIAEADMLIIGGTSLVVYPAAGLIDYYQGHKLVVINKSVTPRDRQADLVISDSICACRPLTRNRSQFSWISCSATALTSLLEICSMKIGSIWGYFRISFPTVSFGIDPGRNTAVFAILYLPLF
jgi:hypothetical protein